MKPIAGQRMPRRSHGFSWCRLVGDEGITYRLYWRMPCGRLYGAVARFYFDETRGHMARELRRLRNNVRVMARELRNAA